MNKLDGSPCPFCGDGTLNRGFNDVEYQYKGHTLLIQQPGTYCDLCHESILEPSDLKSNRRDLQAFRSRVDGLLEPGKIKSARKALGLNQKDAGELFGGGHNAFSRYERGEIAPPKALSLLLELLDKHKELRNEVVPNKL